MYSYTTILEVTGRNITNLNGFIEVVGKQTDVVIANPNGIVSNNFGYINPGRAILTTGNPQIDASERLAGFVVNQGEISIEGKGLDAARANGLDLYAQAVKSNAQIAAQKLKMVGGSDYHGANKTVALGALNAEGRPVNEKTLTIVPELVRRQREHPFHLIGIEKGHNPGACFWILPGKVHDVHLSTWAEDNLDCMDDAEISILESAFKDFLYLIFKRHFDNDLPENAGRGDEYLPNNYEDGIAFEWYLTENFYTFTQIEAVLSDIRQVAALLRSDFDHPALFFLRAGIRNLHYYFLPLSFDTKYTEEEKEKIAKENIEHLIDFYVRFDASLREMIKVGRANGYRLISVCGP